MNREEVIMKEVEDCFEYFDKDGYDEEFLTTPSAEKITDLIIKHEQDTLKEFVEWFRNNYYFAKYPLFAKNTKELIENFLKEKE